MHCYNSKAWGDGGSEAFYIFPYGSIDFRMKSVISVKFSDGMSQFLSKSENFFLNNIFRS